MADVTEEPRAYTESEVVDMILGHIRHTVRYWAKLPDFDPATGNPRTIEYRCEGVAFSILSMLDGCSMSIPAIDLVMSPNPDDKEYLKAEGDNWFEPEMRISVALHERFYVKQGETDNG